MRDLPNIHSLIQTLTLDSMAAAPSAIGPDHLKPNAAVVRPVDRGLEVIGYARVTCWTSEDGAYGFFQPIGNSGGWIHLARSRVLLFPDCPVLPMIPLEAPALELVVGGQED